MAPRRRRACGFTLVEMIIGLSLTAVILAAVATAMHAARESHDYNAEKSDLVACARGVLDRIVDDVRHAESTAVSEAGDAVNVLVVKPGGDRIWRQYRRQWDSQARNYVLLVYEDATGIPFPPTQPEQGTPSETLARNVTNFNVVPHMTSPQSHVEQLYFHIVATCGENAGNEYIMPMKEGVYVLKLSETQFNEVGPVDGVDILEPRPRYQADDTPNVYWLCMEDAQAPAVALSGADWDFEDLMVRVTEYSNEVEFEVHWGTGSYTRDIMAPDGSILYPCVGGTHTYTYTPPFGVDCDGVRVDLELENDGVAAGASTTATQRRHAFRLNKD